LPPRLPLLDIDVIDYIKSVEFRQWLASTVLTPLAFDPVAGGHPGTAQRFFGG